MSADANDALRLIRDSAAAIAPRQGDLGRIRALRFARPGFDRAVWRQMAELGWLGLLVEETRGGSGLGPAELCALAEELGAGLVPEPLPFAAAIAPLLPDAAAVIAGERIVLPAWQERPNTLAPGTATRFAGGRVSGTKQFIPMADGADAFLVATADGLALVERDAPGVTLDLAMTQDGGHFGTLTLSNAPATPVPGRIEPALETITLALAATALGLMDRAFALSLDYLRTRRQFGRAIGSFQALQHRAADLKLQLELTRATVAAAAAAPSPAAISRAKARAAEASLLLTRQAIQLHGGIGYTDEYDVGLFLRKAMVIANLHGSAALHRARFAALAPDITE